MGIGQSTIEDVSKNKSGIRKNAASLDGMGKNIRENNNQIEILNHKTNNMGIGYGQGDVDKLHYRKRNINNFFTGKDEVPLINDETGDNNTLFYTKADMKKFMTGNKQGEISPGPYINQSEFLTKMQTRDEDLLELRNTLKIIKDMFNNYYTKEDADKTIESVKELVGNTYTKEEIDAEIASIKTSLGNYLTKENLDSMLHTNMVIVNAYPDLIVSGYSGRFPDNGRAYYITNKITKIRKCYIHVTKTLTLNMFVNNSMYFSYNRHGNAEFSSILNANVTFTTSDIPPKFSIEIRSLSVNGIGIVTNRQTKDSLTSIMVEITGFDK